MKSQNLAILSEMARSDWIKINGSTTTNQNATMKTTAVIVSFILHIAVSLNAQELRNVAPGAPLTVTPDDIVQIVGVAVEVSTGTLHPKLPELVLSFASGTTITNPLGENQDANSPVSNSLIGHVFTGLNRLSIVSTSTKKAVVTVKIMTQASQTVSTPMVLPPVDDEIYTITLETSTDMKNWVPAYPGDYLGNGSHRFFRVKAVRKPATTP